jgi:hypothetical protein
MTDRVAIRQFNTDCCNSGLNLQKIAQNLQFKQLTALKVKFKGVKAIFCRSILRTIQVLLPIICPGVFLC